MVVFPTPLFCVWLSSIRKIGKQTLGCRWCLWLLLFFLIMWYCAWGKVFLSKIVLSCVFNLLTFLRLYFYSILRKKKLEILVNLTFTNYNKILNIHLLRFQPTKFNNKIRKKLPTYYTLKELHVCKLLAQYI